MQPQIPGLAHLKRPDFGPQVDACPRNDTAALEKLLQIRRAGVQAQAAHPNRVAVLRNRLDGPLAPTAVEMATSGAAGQSLDVRAHVVTAAQLASPRYVAVKDAQRAPADIQTDRSESATSRR
eukprot:scaffold803_cov310-Pinguiococcus_pyrenoidosus.AAC.61